ncbi:50S ribosomal protein L18 [Candidatus Fermentibacterales bacterium]|nr:50S ribosomal protein L18 [Candidatus Fermentibacterales bacterium]
MGASRRQKRDFRHSRIRRKLCGTMTRPRLCVFRSNRHITASLVDDDAGRTIATLSTSARDFASGQRETKTQMAGRLGTRIAEIARDKGISEVVFDRGGYRYHGRVRAVAENAREAGLRF